jgi:hypothetical protein
MSDDRLTTRDMARSIETATANPPSPNPPSPPTQTADARALPMFSADEASGYRTRWDAVQTGFVDEPRRAVEEADSLVAQVIKRLTEVFADERTNLEHQWDQGDQISTEDLRIALRKYRSFFDRLLSL